MASIKWDQVRCDNDARYVVKVPDFLLNSHFLHGLYDGKSHPDGDVLSHKT